jgi:hypothetical protein
MNLDPAERQQLAELADLLIPAGNGFPSASEAGVAQEGLDQVLVVRPDLIEPLKKLLALARDRSSSEFLRDLQANDPGAFGVLAELIPGAYFLNPSVRARLNYDGQSARPIDPRADYLDDGLLQSVIDRGPVYRPTPTVP